MPSVSHPDRHAATLANLATAAAGRNGPFDLPGAGAADCRIDLKLLQWRALAAAAGSPAAAAHVAQWPAAAHPDLWAGTVQDGVARGFAARLEEAIALAPPTAEPPPIEQLPGARVTSGKDLRRKKDLLVASRGARVRFTRKGGVLLVDRDRDVHSENCLRFEARADRGTLDAFDGAADERPRLYSAQFLQPLRYVEATDGSELVLAGRLGRGPVGWQCELTFTGHASDDALDVTMRVRHDNAAWRLRVRWLGVPSTMIEHACTPVHEVVANDAGGFVAFTLVRACTALLVDGTAVAVPSAACGGPIVHRFRIGAPLAAKHPSLDSSSTRG